MAAVVATRAPSIASHACDATEVEVCDVGDVEDESTADFDPERGLGTIHDDNGAEEREHWILQTYTMCTCSRVDETYDCQEDGIGRAQIGEEREVRAVLSGCSEILS